MMCRELTSSIACFALVASLVACSDDEATSSTSSLPAPTAAFVSDDSPTPPSVTLRAASLTADSLQLEVVGHGIDDLYGVSFRIETDAAALSFASFSSDYPITRGQVANSGVAFFVASASGAAPGRAVDDAVIGTVNFTRLSGASSPVQFVKNRSDVVDATGNVVSGVSWIGGELRIE